MRRVLWTLVPLGSLGLLGWVPPLRIAFRKKTPAAWLWFAGFAAAFVVIMVLAGTVHGSAEDDTPDWIGDVEVFNMIITALYTAIASKALTPKPKAALFPPQPLDFPGYGYGHRPVPAPAPGYGYGGYPAAPAAYPPASPVAGPVPAGPNAMAAEVQAELRQLRDLLGESAADRAYEVRDGRGEQ